MGLFLYNFFIPNPKDRLHLLNQQQLFRIPKP